MTTQATAPAKAPEPKSNHATLKLQFLEDEPPLRGKFHRWLKKHDHRLTLVGAIIVFFTFVAKEGLQEKFRGLDDAISGAENLFLLRKDADDLRFRIMNVAEQLKLKEPKITFIQNTDEDNYLSDDVGDETMDIIHVLAKKVNDPKINNRIKKIDEDRDDLNNEAYELAMLPYGDDDNNNPDYIENKKSEINSSVEKLHAQMSEVASDLVKVSRNAKKKAESNLRIATWASYFLYTLGWGLGLVGRLLGVSAGTE